MIDYQKLKIAHDIMVKHNKYFCTFEFGWCDRVKFCLFDDENENQIYHCYSIDDLISKLTQLTNSDSKFKIGDIVWWLAGNVPIKGFYTPSDRKNDAHLYPNKKSLIEAQIEYWKKLKDDGNILRWQDQAPSFKGQTIQQSVYNYQQCEEELKNKLAELRLKFDQTIAESPELTQIMNELKDNIQMEQHEVDVDRCQHESDGKVYINKPGANITDVENLYSAVVNNTYKNKCKKCGEFYRIECQHESDGQAYAHASGYLHKKCIKCGEFYR